MKKLDGIFGLKLDEYFDENQFTIISKELNHGDYHITIDSPPNPNVLFKDYSIRCSKDMIIQDISAKTLSPIPFEKAKARQEDIENYFIETYFDNYAIYYWEFENFMHVYEFIPYDNKIIPLRSDYRNFVNPNETTKELTLTIFGESDNFKQVEIFLSVKNENKDDDPIRIFEDQDIIKFDTGKGYEIDVTGL